MTDIQHHLTEDLIAAYAAGTLGHTFGVVVAAHVSLCLECRARLEAHEHVGGAVLEDLPQETVSADLKSSVLAMLDQPTPPRTCPRDALGHLSVGGDGFAEGAAAKVEIGRRGHSAMHP